VALAAINLKEPAAARVKRGHPWIYANAIAQWEGEVEPGDLVRVIAPGGELLGFAYANKENTIAARLLYSPAAGTRGGGVPNEREEIFRKLDRALSRRNSLELDSDAWRLVWSEADGLPGVVCDVYGPLVVLQLLTAGADKRREWVVEWLATRLKPAGIYERSEGAGRLQEGKSPRRGWLRRPAPAEPDTRIAIHEGPAKYAVNVAAGHKTGFYLDQRAARRALRRQALSGSALDAFCYTGGFTIAAGLAGAERICSVDVSQEALEQLEVNAALNGMSDRVRPCRENAFVYLKAAVERREKYGCVILDPPSFTKTAGEKEDALRGYRELHRRASQLLASGGTLLSCTCSHHIGRDDFKQVALSGVSNTGRRLEILSIFGPDPDHPEISQVPESRYLTCLMAKML